MKSSPARQSAHQTKPNLASIAPGRSVAPPTFRGWPGPPQGRRELSLFRWTCGTRWRDLRRKQQDCAASPYWGIGFGQTLSNGEAVGIGFERGLEIALRVLHAANLFVTDREIA